MISGPDYDFWRTEGINWYRWPNGPVHHEGEENIKKIIEYVGERSVRDICCGYGRLANIFKPELYVGYDICEAAIKKGTKMFPDYKFVHWNYEKLQPAEVTLIVSSAKCINDDSINEFLSLVCVDTKFIVLAEILDGRHDDPLNYNVYPRSLEQYKQLLNPYGFKFVESSSSQHVHIPLQFTVTLWELQ